MCSFAQYLYQLYPLFQWIPPPQETIKEKEAEEQIAIDLGEEYEQALSSATQEEIIDLAGKINHFQKSIVLEFKDKQCKIVLFFQLFLVSIP